jgi:hypothetical protein
MDFPALSAELSARFPAEIGPFFGEFRPRKKS